MVFPLFGALFHCSVSCALSPTDCSVMQDCAEFVEIEVGAFGNLTHLRTMLVELHRCRLRNFLLTRTVSSYLQRHFRFAKAANVSSRSLSRHFETVQDLVSKQELI